MTASTFSILTVCTGNICRSPLAAQLLRAGVKSWPEVAVASAGTHAMVGSAMPDQAQTLAKELGVMDYDAHIARSLTAELLREADLVIALTRSHRRQIAEMLPRGTRHTFTLRELARLVKGITDGELEYVARLPAFDRVGRLRELVEVAASRRGTLAPSDSPEDDDVVDPYQHDDVVYRESAEQIVPAVNGVLTQFARVLALRS